MTKMLSIPVPAHTVELPVSIGKGSVIVEVPIPAGVVPVDEAVVISVLSQIPAGHLISYLQTRGYFVERMADA